VSEALNEAKDRIWSMALVHETLYRSKNLAQINASVYLGRLVMNIAGSVRGEARNVSVDTEIEELAIGIDVAVNCGLILNELLSNCFKHAFPDGRDGEVKISFSRIKRDLVELAVTDNGVGIPPELDIAKVTTFGLDLVKELVSRIKGEISCDRNHGTEFRIRFREAPDSGVM